MAASALMGLLDLGWPLSSAPLQLSPKKELVEAWLGAWARVAGPLE